MSTPGTFNGRGPAARIALLITVIAATVAAAALVAAADGAATHKRGTLDTVAGTGRRGFTGDGKRARRAKVASPRSVAVDRAGNVYFVAPEQNRVRKVDTHGKITTLAGTGKKGFSGDGGAARKARLRFPHSVAVDSHENVYIADMLNWRVRKVDPHGTITTLAGTGTSPTTLDSSGEGGPAAQARIDAQEVAVDRHDNVLIRGADCVIRKVDTNGTLTRIVGNPYRAGKGCGHEGDGGPATSARIAPGGQIGSDNAGNLYLADAFEARVRRVAPDGTISTFAGTGKRGFSGNHVPATKAKLQNPMGVAVDGKSNVFIADLNRIRKVNRKGIITTIAGTGKLTQLAHNGDPARKVDYWGPEQLAINGRGDLIVGDPSSSRVWVLYRIAAPVR